MMQSEIVSEHQPDVSFLSLKNRSRLPGHLPFPAPISKKILPSLRFSFGQCMELFVVGAISFGFISTLAIGSLRGKEIMGIYTWKLALFALLFSGSRLGCASLVRVFVSFLHALLPSYDRILYVVQSVQHSVARSFAAWICLAAWEVVFGELQNILESPAMNAFEKFLICCGIVLSLWVIKSTIVMSLAAWFHVRTYREKIYESLFYRYVVQGLSGLPLVDISSFLPEEANIGLRDLEKLNPKSVTSWKMKKMMIAEKDCKAVKIRSVLEARVEAEKIFHNVSKPNAQFIDLEDLKRFLPKEEASKTLNIFRRTYEDDENIQISLLFLQEWMVHSFKRHRCLILSLKDTDASSSIIGTIFNVIFGVFLVALSVPLLGIGGESFLMLFSVNSFIITFLFGLIWKEMFFSLQLLYIRHPFDVGDEVMIEQIEMYVEKLKITETEFVGRDKKRYTISNYGLYDKLVMNNSRSEVPAWCIENSV